MKEFHTYVGIGVSVSISKANRIDKRKVTLMSDGICNCRRGLTEAKFRDSRWELSVKWDSQIHARYLRHHPLGCLLLQMASPGGAAIV